MKAMNVILLLIAGMVLGFGVCFGIGMIQKQNEKKKLAESTANINADDKPETDKE